jgi:hypothetical protein
VAAFLFHKFVELRCIDDALSHGGYSVAINTGVDAPGLNDTHNQLVCMVYETALMRRGNHLAMINSRFGDNIRMRIHNLIHQISKPGYCLSTPNWLTKLLAFSTKIETLDNIHSFDRRFYFRANLNLSSLMIIFNITPTTLIVYHDIAQKLEPYLNVQKGCFLSEQMDTNIEIGRKKCSSGDGYLKFKVKYKKVMCPGLPKYVSDQILANAIGIEIEDNKGNYTNEYTALCNITSMQKASEPYFKSIFRAHKVLNFVDRLNRHMEQNMIVA